MSINLLFEERDKSFEYYTKQIFFQIPHVLDGVVEHLKLQSAAENGRVKWTGIELMGDGEDESRTFVVIFGAVDVEPGDSVPLRDGSVVIATEENLSFLVKTIKVGITLDLVNNGSKDEVVNFLKENDRNKPVIDPNKISSILAEVQKQKEYQSPDLEGFDTSTLTTDQLNSLHLYIKSKRGEEE